MPIADLLPELVLLCLVAGAVIIALFVAFAPRCVLALIEALAGMPAGGH